MLFSSFISSLFLYIYFFFSIFLSTLTLNRGLFIVNLLRKRNKSKCLDLFLLLFQLLQIVLFCFALFLFFFLLSIYFIYLSIHLFVCTSNLLLVSVSLIVHLADNVAIQIFQLIFFFFLKYKNKANKKHMYSI